MADYRWTPKYVVLTLKIEGGGDKYVHRKVFLELKRIFILKEISIILSKLFTLCSTRKRRFNKFESNHDDKR